MNVCIHWMFDSLTRRRSPWTCWDPRRRAAAASGGTRTCSDTWSHSVPEQRVRELHTNNNNNNTNHNRKWRRQQRAPHLVSTLLLTHLTVPAQLLEPLGLDPVPDRLRGQKIRFSHRDHRHGAEQPTERREAAREEAPEERRSTGFRGLCGDLARIHTILRSRARVIICNNNKLN